MVMFVRDSFLDPRPAPKTKDYKAVEAKMLLADLSLTITPAKPNLRRSNTHSYLFWKRPKTTIVQPMPSIPIPTDTFFSEDVAPRDHQRRRRGSGVSLKPTKSWRREPRKRRPSSDENFLNAKPMSTKKRHGVVFIDEPEVEHLSPVNIRPSADDVRPARLRISRVPKEASSTLNTGNELRDAHDLPRKDSCVMGTILAAGAMGRPGTGTQSSDGNKDGYLDFLAEADPGLYNTVIAEELELMLSNHSRSFVEEMTAFINAEIRSYTPNPEWI